MSKVVITDEVRFKKVPTMGRCNRGESKRLEMPSGWGRGIWTVTTDEVSREFPATGLCKKFVLERGDEIEMLSRWLSQLLVRKASSLRKRNPIKTHDRKFGVTPRLSLHLDKDGMT